MKTLFIMLAAPAANGGLLGGAASFLPLILIIVVFYFFMIRPQVKKQKALQKFRSELAKGDKVVTTGGIYGKIEEIHDNFISLKVDANTTLKVDKAAVVKDMSDVEPQKK